jgi:hypothetical protein
VIVTRWCRLTGRAADVVRRSADGVETKGWTVPEEAK